MRQISKPINFTTGEIGMGAYVNSTNNEKQNP